MSEGTDIWLWEAVFSGTWTWWVTDTRRPWYIFGACKAGEVSGYCRTLNNYQHDGPNCESS